MTVIGKYKGRLVGITREDTNDPHILFLPCQRQYWAKPLINRFEKIKEKGDYTFLTDDGFEVTLSDLGELFEQIKTLKSLI